MEGKITGIELNGKILGVDLAVGDSKTVISITDQGGHVQMAGTIEDWHWMSQRVWYKPWTWFKKPIRAIDKMILDHIGMVGPRK